jgi:hypothetical protein
MGTLLALANDCSPAGRFVLLLYGKQIEEVNLRSWPGPDIGSGFSVAVITSTKFLIPVVRFGKANDGFDRLLCSVSVPTETQIACQIPDSGFSILAVCCETKISTHGVSGRDPLSARRFA